MRRFLFLLASFLLVLNCLVIGGFAYYLTTRSATLSLSRITPSRPNPRPTATLASTPGGAVRLGAASPLQPSPTLASRTSTPLASNATLELLLNLTIPENDAVALTARFKKLEGVFATPVAPKTYQVGDKEQFWVGRKLNGEYERITATLRYVTAHAYWWVEEGERIDNAGLKRSADLFERKIYPTNRKYLGSEATPGIDNDPRIHILHARIDPAIAGMYSPADALPQAVNRYSNQREMLYISSRGAARPGTDYYESILAHELTHMIHDAQNRRGESSWITEGLGDLGMELNGYASGHETSFAQDPDLQLNAWDIPPGNWGAHYGAAYLFLSYLLNRFGLDFIRDVVATDTTGIPTIQRALDKHAPGLRFDDVFADWVVANYINDTSQAPRYGYLTDALRIRPSAGFSRYPAKYEDTVHQYGADYIQLLPEEGDITFHFDGADTVRVLPTHPHSGKYFWWSSRTDESDTRLTREIDLTDVDAATLKFWTWYDIEDDYDFAYVSVSTDGGKTWTPLEGRTTTDRDKNGANFGNGLTCKSGVGCDRYNASPIWIEEEMDLTPYAGRRILLRFEYVTDAVYSGAGFVIDDISIPEIGFSDNAEGSDGAWIAEGFARIDNILPQRFIAQAIEFGQVTRVVPIALDEKNRGSYATHGFGQGIDRIVIAISGSTPITWEPAAYSFTIQ